MVELKRMLTLGGAVIVALIGLIMLRMDSALLGVVNLALAGVIAWQGFTAEPEDL